LYEEHVQVNAELPKIILSRFVVVKYHDEYTGKEEYVIIQEDDEEEDVRIHMIEEEYYSALGWLPPPL